MTVSVRRFSIQLSDYLLGPLRLRYREPLEIDNAYRWQFNAFEHPLVCGMIGALNGGAPNGAGMDALFDFEQGPPSADFFVPSFEPNPDTVLLHSDVASSDELSVSITPKDELDFSITPAGVTQKDGSTLTIPSGAYAAYNWELFFHAPFLIATTLSQNQRFLEARQWFHYIFNPTESAVTAPEVWKFPPFRREATTWANGAAPTLADLLAAGGNMQAQVGEMMDDPFQPHRIAELRIIPYQKAVVLAYIDNLIAWGDQLFRMETLEAINEATLLYILSAELLGKRPQSVSPPQAAPSRLTFNQLKAQALPADDAANPDEIENLLLQGAVVSISGETGTELVTSIAKKTSYFCIPHNDLLLSYWDTVADRLFKIRNSMNIEGDVRQLPLFEPPINPDLLVRAAAAGVDLTSVVADATSPVPIYRFTTMLQRATELCADVKGLGALLLSALEKQDAEALGRLRSGNEVDLLKAVRDVKQKQLDEANATKDGLVAYAAVLQARSAHYANLIKTGNTSNENDQISQMNTSSNLMAAQATAEYVGTVLALIPQLHIGLAPETDFGGNHIANALRSLSGALGATSSAISVQASLSGIQASYGRRLEEWQLQQELADKELVQNTSQQAAAQARIDLATIELQNHDKQIDQASAVDDFLRDKFTNDELFGWMVGQVSELYFQSYQMVFEIAKRAERAFHFEIGDFDGASTAAPFVQYGHWDSLRKGLLAGERLHFDLKRMEASYLDRNRRELEITKHVSLAEVDPEALLELRETGQCYVTLDEALFDADFPGHYMRRLKTVGLSIPCVTGPYAGVCATLTLLWSRIRYKTTLAQSRSGGIDETADRVNNYESVAAAQAVVTSSGQNDSGLFEVNLRDERYLPFEGAGAVSLFRLEVPRDTNTFDRETMTDVIVHVRYTARSGGDALAAAVRAVRGMRTPFAATAPNTTSPKLEPPTRAPRLFSAAHDFANAWFEFLYRAPADGQAQALVLPLRQDHFPPSLTPPFKPVHIGRIVLALIMKAAKSYDAGDPLKIRVVSPTATSDSFAFAIGLVAGVPTVDVTIGDALADPMDPAHAWRVEVIPPPPSVLASSIAGATTRIGPDNLEDIAILAYYDYA